MYFEKISLLNQTILECLGEFDEHKVIKSFAELGIKVLEGDFGFVWLNSSESSELKLVYKSRATPYKPHAPRKEGRNYTVIKSRTPDYVSRVKKRLDEYDVSKYMKSFVIIPISHHEKVYGNMVVCFREQESFAREKKILCSFIGNAVGDAITIRRLLINEKERSKTEFLTQATHELRTPLAIIKGTVDLTLQSKAKNSTETVRALHVINEEVGHMSVLVSDLSLLMSSEKSFREEIVQHEVNLHTLINKVVQRCKSVAHKKHISLRILRVPHSSILGDEMYLERLFSNIIKNTIVYGKENTSVKISGSAQKTLVHIQIIAHHMDISPKDLPHVFDKFYSSTRSLTKNHEELGLGLAVAK